MEQQLTEQQKRDIEIITPWAKTKLPRVYDIVKHFKTVNGIDTYQLIRSEWGTSKRKGLPVLAFVENGEPVRITDIHDILTITSF